MNEFVIRKATTKDIPFLVDTIIEAEKSGTEILSYSTVFGLTELEVKNYLKQMLAEEVENSELSVSSFLVAEKDGVVAAALSAWIEGFGGMSSSMLKGNLLKYFLPKQCFERAAKINNVIRDVHIEYIPNSIQIGAGYVAKEFRRNGLLGILNKELIESLANTINGEKVIYAQIFPLNLPSMKTYEKAGFDIILTKKSNNEEILKYLPSNEKILLKKVLE